MTNQQHVHRPEPFMVEASPPNFVERPEEFEQLINALLADRSVPGEKETVGVQSRAVAAQTKTEQLRAIAITAALRGAGGYGKTTLARKICHDPRIWLAFPEGILWVTLGEKPANLSGLLEDLIYELEGKRPGFADTNAAAAHLHGLLANRRALLVVDDVWQPESLRPFLQVGAGGAVLITTRNDDTLPQETEKVNVESMKPDEALQVIGAGLEVDGETGGLKQLAGRLGEWPLLLKLANPVLRQYVELGSSVAEALAEANLAYDQQGLGAFDEQSAPEKTLEVSLQMLNPEEQARFLELAIFPEDAEVAIDTLQRLWGATGNLNGLQARRLCLRLFEHSLLLKLDLKAKRIRLHDMVRVFLRKKQGSILKQLHGRLVEAYRAACCTADQSCGQWERCPDDGYYCRYLAYHLHEAGWAAEVFDLLGSFAWLRHYLQGGSVNTLLVDYDRALETAQTEEAEALRLIRETLQLSAFAISQDLDQLAGQLLGRLLPFGQRRITGLLSQAEQWHERPWLKPLRPCLTPPGGRIVRRLAGHANTVAAVAITPNGRFAVSGSYDNTLKFWDLSSGEMVRTFTGHSDKVNAVAITPDGRLAVSGSGDKTLNVWNLSSGEIVRTLAGHSNGVMAVAIAPDGRLAVSGSMDKTLRIWDLNSGELVRKLTGHSNGVMAVAITPDGRFAVSGASDKTLQVWDLNSGELVRKLTGHAGAVIAVAITPDGRFAVSGASDELLKVWDLSSGELVRTFTGHAGEVFSVAVTPDGQMVISGDPLNKIFAWNLANGEMAYSIAGNWGMTACIAITPDGHFAVCGHWGFLTVWDLKKNIQAPGSGSIPTSLSSFSVTPDGRFALSGSFDNTIKVWDLNSGELVRTLTGHTNRVNDIAITPDGRFAVSGSSDKTLRVWDLIGYEMVRTLDGHFDVVTAVAITPDGRLAVSASFDETLQVWDLSSGEVVRTLAGHSDKVHAVAITPDGQLAVSGSGDNTLQVWDLSSGEVVRTLAGHSDEVHTVAITPDGQLAVSGSGDKTLKVWNLSSGEIMRTLAGHSNMVRAIAISPDGRLAISGTIDSILTAWNLDDGTCLARFYGENPIMACSFSKDGKTIIAGDLGGQIYYLTLQGIEES